MRPHSATAHPFMWLTAAATFLAACGAGLYRSFADEVAAGIVVVALLAFFSLKKMYRTQVSALAALITLGIVAVGFIGALGALALYHHDRLLGGVAGPAMVVFIGPFSLDGHRLRQLNASLALEGKRRRISPIYFAISALLLAGGIALLVAGLPFAGTWMAMVGAMRGVMEVFS